MVIQQETLAIPVARIDPNPWNPNEMAGRVFDAVGESLQEFGQVLPLVVRPHPEAPERYQIIDGEHRWRQATAQGITVVECKVLHVDDPTAKRLTLALSEGGESNKLKLGLLLQDLSSELDVQTILRGISTTEAEMGELLEIAAFNWEEFQQQLEAEAPEPPESPSSPEEVLTIRGEHLSKIRTAYQRAYNEPGTLTDLLDFVLGLTENA